MEATEDIEGERVRMMSCGEEGREIGAAELNEQQRIIAGALLAARSLSLLHCAQETSPLCLFIVVLMSLPAAIVPLHAASADSDAERACAPLLLSMHSGAGRSWRRSNVESHQRTDLRQRAWCSEYAQARSAKLALPVVSARYRWGAGLAFDSQGRDQISGMDE